MKTGEIKNLTYRQIIQELSSHVRLQKYLLEDEKQEINAIASHWLQSPNLKLPFLSHLTRVEFRSFINRKNKTEKTEYNKGNTSEFRPVYDQAFFDFLFDTLPYPPPRSYDFTFIDLFAGIGGFRIAFQHAGGKCVFSSEWDRFAKQTYEANFGELPYGDIRKINKDEIPDHDVLCAGFPCQPFSLAGVSKKQSLGKKHGFEDKTQGTLFFDIKEILRIKRPKAFMLENVKNLISHDKGRTFEVIRQALEDDLGYIISWKIVDGAKWVPQHRERIFIIGYDPKQIQIRRKDIIIPEKPGDDYNYPELKSIIEEEVSGHTLGPGTWATLERHKAYHSKQGNGFGYGLHSFPVKKEAVTRTISARYHKDGAEILIEQKNKRPRRLTVKEAMQLQGYDPEKFIFPVSNTQAYKQIGNSVVVPAIQESAVKIAKILKGEKQNDDIERPL